MNTYDGFNDKELVEGKIKLLQERAQTKAQLCVSQAAAQFWEYKLGNLSPQGTQVQKQPGTNKEDFREKNDMGLGITYSASRDNSQMLIYAVMKIKLAYLGPTVLFCIFYTFLLTSYKCCFSMF